MEEVVSKKWKGRKVLVRITSVYSNIYHTGRMADMEDFIAPAPVLVAPASAFRSVSHSQVFSVELPMPTGRL